MRGILVMMLLALAGCGPSDAEEARQACGGDSVTYAAEVARCRAAFMAERENQRAVGLAVMGVGLMNYGAARSAPVYTAPQTATCYRVGGMVQCNGY